MGRGRAKAKQTKVARDLKYRTHETDFGALARELHGEDSNQSDQASDELDDHDEWSDYIDSRPSRD
jgi:hypothetical protein